MKKSVIICAIIVVICVILALLFILKPQKSEPTGTNSVSSQSSLPTSSEQSSSESISSVANGEFRFQGRVIEFIEGYALVETFPSSANYPVSDRVYISTAVGPSLRVGTRVEVVHGDGIMMSNPPRIGNIYSITLIDQDGNPL